MQATVQQAAAQSSQALLYFILLASGRCPALVLLHGHTSRSVTSDVPPYLTYASNCSMSSGSILSGFFHLHSTGLRTVHSTRVTLSFSMDTCLGIMKKRLTRPRNLQNYSNNYTILQGHLKDGKGCWHKLFVLSHSYILVNFKKGQH
jgi:hypothetical protein